MIYFVCYSLGLGGSLTAALPISCEARVNETKKCPKCGQTKQLPEFGKNQKTKDRRGGYCKECAKQSAREWRERNPEYAAEKARKYREDNPEWIKSYRSTYNRENREYFRVKNKEYMWKNPERYLWYDAKSRAKEAGLPFDLELSDIVIPAVCPVLGIPLAKSEGYKSAGSPSVDRLIPELGYVKGNISVISFRANWIKNNGTLEEHRKITAWMESQLSLTEASA